MSACLSDPRILSFSLGIFTLVALRWNTLPQDVATLQTVVSYAKRVVSVMCSRRTQISEHMSTTEHFPRPPRVSSASVGGMLLPDPPSPKLQSSDAQEITDSTDGSSEGEEEEEEEEEEDS
jgi:hypothetical protein